MGVKAAASIVLLVLTAAACGGSHRAAPPTQHYPPAKSPLTSAPTPTPTPTAEPTRVSATIRIVIDPFKKGTIGPGETGLKPGWSIDRSREKETLDCTGDTGSPFAVGISTHWCGSTADSARACWTERYSTGHLWCLNALKPSSHRLWSIGSDHVSDFTPRAKHPHPLFLELADGSRWWARTGGTWGGRADGLSGIYACANKLGVCSRAPGTEVVVLAGGGPPDIDKSSALWRVRVGRIGDPNKSYPAPRWQAVTRAWFMAGHLWPTD